MQTQHTTFTLHGWLNKYLFLGMAAALLIILPMENAQARILFQDDDFHEIESDFILIGSNDAGAVNTGIQFGNDSVASENGTITWNISTNTFEFDNTVAITGGLSADGVVNFSDSTSFRIREEADVIDGTTVCSTVGELALDLGENSIYICIDVDDDLWTPNVATAFVDFDDVYAASVANTNLTMEINNAGGLAFDLTSTGNFLIQDNGGTIAAFNNTGSIAFTPTSGQNLTITTDGAGDIILTSADSIDITADIFNVNTTGAGSVNFTGTSNVTTDTGDLTISTTTSGDLNLTAADDVNITAGGNLYFSDGNFGDTIQLSETATNWSSAFSSTGIVDNLNALAEAASANSLELKFYPEYPDTVVYRDGTNNQGTLTADRDNTNNRSYYQWTTNNANLQDIDLRFRIVLPPDFDDVEDLTFEYQTGTTNDADNKVNVTIVNVTNSNTTCATSVDNTSTTWAVGTITKASIETNCTGTEALDAGDTVEIIVKFFDKGGVSTFARSGFIKLDYSNSF